MVKKQRLGNPQLQIRVDREILAAAEQKLGGRRGVGRRIKAMLASEIDAPGAGGDAYLQALQELNVKTLAVVSNNKTGIGGIASVLKVMAIQLDNLDERFKKIESNHVLTQKAILLLAERLGVADARSPTPATGKKG